MAETKPLHAAPVEGDGVSYSGIVWFIVILAVTMVFCEVLVWGMFKFVLMPYRTVQSRVAPLAEPHHRPEIKDGRLVTGLAVAPTPGLNVTEPIVLKEFRDAEDASLQQYGWVDQGSQVVRLPIDRAKELLMARGLPVRPSSDEAPKGAVASR
jgi:hypothetical protein